MWGVSAYEDLNISIRDSGRVEEENMNRLGIFLFYDEDGIVDDYIEYMLDDISTTLQKLVIVCNGVLSVSGRRIFEKYSNDIIVRENTGFDFCAWKEAMLDYLGYSRIKEYDQLILFNDSFFGPFCPFSEIFADMDQRDFDFWGLTVHGEVETVKRMCPYGYRPRYIQTYFLAFNKRMLNDYSFYNYWQNIKAYDQFLEVSEKISAALTKYFEDLGFSWGVYSDTTDLETTRETNICQHAFNTYELVSNRKYPILKRKSFVLGKSRFLKYNNGLDLQKAVDYVQSHTNYDMSMIYKHLIRRYELPDLKESLNLNFIIPEEENKGIDRLLLKKTLLICHLFYVDTLEYYAAFLNRIPGDIALLITTDTEEKREYILKAVDKDERELYVDVVPNRGRYVSALLIHAKQYMDKYEYLCILHDAKPNRQSAITIGNTFRDTIWENTLHSEWYIKNILEVLSQNEHIGMLVPPVPVYGVYYNEGMEKNDKYFADMETWNRLLDSDYRLPEKKYLLAIGGTCWCKTAALENIFCLNIGYEDFPEEISENADLMRNSFEVLLPYIAQKNGYFTGWCMNVDYAACEMENYRYMNREIIRLLHEEAGIEGESYQQYLAGIRQYIKKAKRNAQKVKKQETEVQYVEVPVLVEIGLKRALKNYIMKKLHIKGKKS